MDNEGHNVMHLQLIHREALHGLQDGGAHCYAQIGRCHLVKRHIVRHLCQHEEYQLRQFVVGERDLREDLLNPLHAFQLLFDVVSGGKLCVLGGWQQTAGNGTQEPLEEVANHHNATLLPIHCVPLLHPPCELCHLFIRTLHPEYALVARAL